MRCMVHRFAAWLDKYHRKHHTPGLASLNILERLWRVRR